MLLIACPWCGPRAEIEFVWGGEAGRVRPEPVAQSSDAAWAAYLYGRENREGVQSELWRHAFGCRQWFVLSRDTSTHEIREARAITAASMEGAPPEEAGA